MKAEPQSEHRWLEQLVGEWTYDTEEEAPESTGAPPAWIESVRSLNGVWIVAEGRGEMPEGESGTTLMTLGFDPASGHFVGTWVGSMMTHLWVYRGSLDETGRVLTLDTEGPNFSGGEGSSRYQDIIELIGDDRRTLTSRVQGEDGAWTQIMKAHYRRSA